MAEGTFDNYLRSRINKDDIEVPRKVSLGIESTLNGISRNKGGSSLKRAVKAAAIICTLTIGLMTAFPAVARSIPVINKILGESSIFRQAFSSQSPELHFSNLNEVGNYAIAVDKQIQNITVRELAYDGVAFYTVWDVTDTSKDPMESIHLYGSSLAINDGNEISAGVFIPERLDEHTVRVVQVYPVPGGLSIPNEVIVSIRFSKDGVTLPDVNIQLDRSQLLASVKTVELNTKVKLGSTTALLRSMTQSPAYVSLTMDIGTYEPNKYEFVLLDSQGNELTQVDMGRIESKGRNTTVTRFYKAPITGNTIDRILVLAANTSNFRQLNSHSPASFKARAQVELNAALPATVPVGSDKEITVTGIEWSSKGLRVEFSAINMGINTFIRMGGIALWDQDDSYRLSVAESLGKNTYLITYNVDGFDYGNAVLSIGNYDEAIAVVHEIRAGDQD